MYHPFFALYFYRIVVYLIHKQCANSELPHTHDKNSSNSIVHDQEPITLRRPSCHVTTLLVPGLHLLPPPPPQVLKQARKQTKTGKKLTSLKLKTVHGGHNESISKNAVAVSIPRWVSPDRGGWP